MRNSGIAERKRTGVTAATRQTRQKQALRDAFVQADRPLSPDETLQLARESVPGMNIATVYRNIAALLEDKWLATVELPGAAPRYEVAGKGHHHHFQCKVCTRMYELAGCDLPLKPTLPAGFRLSGHELVLYGTCANCPA